MITRKRAERETQKTEKGKSKKVKGKRNAETTFNKKIGFRRTFDFLLLPFAFPLPFTFLLLTLFFR